MGVFDEGINLISKETKQHSVLATLDSLSSIFYKNSGRRYDSININEVLKVTDDFDFYIALEDVEKYSAKEILENYKVKGFVKRLMVKQKLKMLKEGTGFISFLMGKVTWAVFIVLLLLTFVFKLLYFKSDFLYLEHLVFGMHLNSFFLIIVSILSLMPEVFIERIMPWVLVLMAIFLFVAMKRVYKQSFIVTGLKVLPVIVCYFFSFIFGVVLTVIGSFLIF